MSIDTSKTLKKFTGVVTHFYDTEDNYLAVDPITIPGVMYAYLANTGKVMLKIGTGAKWSTISPIGGDGVPIGTLIYHIAPTAPDGYILLNGDLISRDTYRELYNFAVDSTLIVSDTVWCANKAHQGFFSYGNDKDTFRLPKLHETIISGWANEDDDQRTPASYKPGTIIGTDYLNGTYTSTPYMSYLSYGVLLRNKLTTNECPVPPDYNSKDNKKDFKTVSEWLTEQKVRDTLIHPTKKDILNSLNLDPIEDMYTEGIETMKTAQIVEDSTDTEYTEAIGMTRPETIAYPIYMKYRSY